MNSKFLKSAPVKHTSSIVAFASALLLQGMVTQASADEFAASFERMLNPAPTVRQSVVTHQVDKDPLHSMVNAALWSAPTSYDNIAASFEYILNPVETSGRSVVAYRVERDPLYTIVNAILWSNPTSHDNTRKTVIAYVQH